MCRAFLNILFSAGVAGPADPEFFGKKMQNFTEKKDPLAYENSQIWATVFDTNTFAPFFVTRAFIDLLTKGAESRNGTASVINISSVAADVKMLVTVMSVSAPVDSSTILVIDICSPDILCRL